MVINLITFASALHKQSLVRNSHEVLLTELEKYFTLHFIDYQHIDQVNNQNFSILFIATGGVERLVIQHFEQLPRPAILLADGMQNSLAAALEISSWLRTRGMKSEILHGDLNNIVKRIFVLASNFRAQKNLQSNRIGVVGAPSSWLISSDVDYLLAKNRWGVEYIDIPLERVYQYYELTSDDEVGEASARLAEKALACRERTPEDMLKAMRLYVALKRIIEEDKLQALTLSCFRLIKHTDTTGCLALALLNDEGIIAGCEGDLQSVFTLLAAKAVTGKTGFMANPSMIKVANKELVLAHCTIGLKQTEQYILRSHFETDSGIGIQGILPTGDVTLLKCGGECLDEYYLATGTLIENTNYINMCRTQVRVRLNSPIDYFLRNPLGNHHILLQGNYETQLQEFMQMNSCKRID
ncbi:protein containing L-fucose isomerase-like protein [gut metagenome]|uniref:Protein containing L-fucose isomerase-like protein n=1 Tax=gut metagenome TaxID=749906 RepID=J9CYJ1_9ZZZZ